MMKNTCIFQLTNSCSGVAMLVLNEKKACHHKNCLLLEILACDLKVDKEEQVCQRVELIERTISKMKKKAQEIKKAISILHHVDSIQIFMCQF